MSKPKGSSDYELYDYKLWVRRFCRDYELSDVAKEQILAMFEANQESAQYLALSELLEKKVDHGESIAVGGSSGVITQERYYAVPVSEIQQLLDQLERGE